MFAVELTAPDGVAHSMAIRFSNRVAAQRASVSAIYGDPFAFWESERRAAENTSKRMAGWSAQIRESENV